MSKNKISYEVKQKVCKAVKDNAIIWDKTKKLHSNRNALKTAWERVAEDVGESEQFCRTTWKSLRDSQRYHKKKTMKSGSACDLELGSSENSSEPWELHEDLIFLEDPSLKRTTDSTAIFSNQSDDEVFEGTSSYAYNKQSSSAKTKCLSGLAESGAQLADNMRKIVELAGTEKSAHAGFLGHLSSIMDELSKKQLVQFQGAVMEMAYEILSRQEQE